MNHSEHTLVFGRARFRNFRSEVFLKLRVHSERTDMQADFHRRYKMGQRNRQPYVAP